MILNFSSPFVFFKTRKTASTSVEASLEEAFWGSPASHGKRASIYRDGFVTGRPNNFRHPIAARWGYLTARRYFGKFSLTSRELEKLLALSPHSSVFAARQALPEDIWHRAKKIVVVRNPWDKAVSDFYWKTRGRVLLGKDFDLFQSYAHQALPIALESEMTQHWDDTWACIRFENLFEDFQRLVVELGGIPPSALPKYKTAVRPTASTYQHLYTKESRDIVGANWKDWVEQFGYRFE